MTPVPETSNGQNRRERPAEPAPDLNLLSTTELQEELVRRRKAVAKLQARRDSLREQLRAVEAEILQLGGASGVGVRTAVSKPRGRTSGAPRRPRAKNSVSLADAIAMAVEVRATVTPAEVSKIVLANGYVSNARNFAMMVANTLARDDRFKRLERGRYERVR